MPVDATARRTQRASMWTPPRAARDLDHARAASPSQGGRSCLERVIFFGLFTVRSWIFLAFTSHFSQPSYAVSFFFLRDQFVFRNDEHKIAVATR